MTESPSPYEQSAYSSAPQNTAPFNVLSIVAFVLSLCGLTIIPIILGHISLSQIKKTGERGRGFGIAALVIGYVTLAIGVIAVIAIVAFAVAASSSGSLSGY